MTKKLLLLLCALAFSVPSFAAPIEIELVQYMTGRGYLQVDDVIMNTVGMILGAGLVSVLRRLAPSRDCNVSAT